jgi:hypothetical protein
MGTIVRVVAVGVVEDRLERRTVPDERVRMEFASRIVAALRKWRILDLSPLKVPTLCEGQRE